MSTMRPGPDSTAERGANAPQRKARGAPERPDSPTATLAAAVLGFFVITLDVSGVTIALPAIGDDLGGSLAGLQWVADGYTLMVAALMLSAGTVSDAVGARRAYSWGLAAFSVASLACGAAPTLGTLVAARVAQGAAAAVMVPASLALIRQTFTDPAERARGIALWTIGGAVAVAAGPVLGGLFTTQWTWRAVFLLNVPAGLAGLLALRGTARSPRRPAALDLPGQLTAVVALASLTYAVIEGGHRGFTGPVPVAAGTAAAAGIAFGTVEARRRAPMLPLGMFRERGVTVPVVAGSTLNAAFYGGVFVLSLFFQEERGQSGLSAGLMFVPMALATACLNWLSPRLVARRGARPVIVLGLLTGALGAAGLATVDAGTPLWPTAALMIPLGAGGALAMPALTSLMLDSVPGERAGAAAALLNTCRQTGGALGIAAFGAFLAGGFAPGMRASLLIAAGLLCASALTARTLLPRR
ncbi:MFS transporter [Actinomadura terrae]|uniref:MFS transporter n=1 Tax=Actinomadura terrae TaxID=604353 RepID=UPI001FA80742|nr:MFS transporter [Actinomadura terrae]